MPSSNMKALLKARPARGAELENVRVPDIGLREVLVRVRATSICGTDLHIYNWDPWSASRIRPPLIFGHEFCGVVERVGEEVTAVKPGDLVSAEMHVVCGQCVQCRTGQSHICRNLRIIGIDLDGCFAEFVKIPESNIWKLDPRIPVDYAAVLDPLGNAVHTVLAGEIAGMTVAVIGCGPIGLFSIAVAKACGASAIYGSEVNENRLKLATRMGATAAWNPKKADLVQEVLAATNGVGVDVVLEMSGHPEGIRQGFAVLRGGGRMSLLGIPSQPIELDLLNDIIFKGATVQGIYGRRMFDTWYRMQALITSGALRLEPVFTERLELDRFERAFDLLTRGEACKILMYPNGIPS